MTREYEVEFKLSGVLESTFKRTITGASNDMRDLYNDAKKLHQSPGPAKTTRSVRDDLIRTQKEMRETNGIFGQMQGALGRTFLPLSVGLGAGALALDSFKKSMNFEAQLDSIQALGGLASHEMKKINDLAMQMGSQTKYSALEAAAGMEELIKAGMTVDQVMGGGLEASLNLATAGGLELAEAAEIMSTAMNAYKRDAMSAAEASNILAGTANASATSVQEMRYSLSAVSAVASGVGQSFRDTNIAIGLFANNGLKGSDAGTSLKTMLLNLLPSTKAQYNEFERLGLMTYDTNKAMQYLSKNGVKVASKSFEDVDKALRQYAATQAGAKLGSDKAHDEYTKLAMQTGAMSSAFYDAKGSLHNLDVIAGTLKKSLTGLNDAQRQMALEIMFGTDAIRAANILYKEGAEGVKKFNGEMSKVTALDVAKAKMDNAKGALEQFNGAMETLQIALLEPTLPLIKKTALAAAEAAEDFKKWLDTDQAKAWGEVIMPILEALPELAMAAASAFAGFKIVSAISSTVEFAKGLKQVTVAGTGATDGIGMLGRAAAFLTNPIGLAVGAVGLLGAGLYTYSRAQEKARQELLNMKETLETAFSNYQDVERQAKETKELAAEYDRLTGKINDSKTPANELTEARRKLKVVEQQLIELNPEILKAEDAKSGKFREQIELAEKLKSTKLESAKRDLEHTIINEKEKLPELQSEYEKLGGDKEFYNRSYYRYKDSYVKFNDYSSRQKSISEDPSLSDEQKKAKLDALSNEIENETGKKFSGYDKWGQLEKTVASTKEKLEYNHKMLLKTEEELGKAESGIQSLYDKQVELIELNLGGSIEEQAKKYKNMTDEQKKLFDESLEKLARLNVEMELIPTEKKVDIQFVYQEIGKPMPNLEQYNGFIPKLKMPGVTKYAKGDIVSGAHFGIYGEAGPEAFIPINNKPRSHALLQQTNKMMGYTATPSGAASSGSGTEPIVVKIESNPTVVVQGNADSNTVAAIKDAVKQEAERIYSQLPKIMADVYRQQARLSFNGSS
ncbi:phage tail tape measure protein [Paenibacillus agilis]|uniref:Phage tail tape measure protein n=1 Tax=Paenibacillus agilis TaxID=3020863 RepID=A0A559IZJ6_9BACL|nr:phage tail tape measure protein [Paenibacillus agilis]TVX93049.1 phage tail tape measure protein [Paenibacillus agilis]